MSSSVGRVTITGYRGEAIEVRGCDRSEGRLGVRLEAEHDGFEEFSVKRLRAGSKCAMGRYKAYTSPCPGLSPDLCCAHSLDPHALSALVTS